MKYLNFKNFLFFPNGPPELSQTLRKKAVNKTNPGDADKGRHKIYKRNPFFLLVYYIK